jgi:hypothetical protein
VNTAQHTATATGLTSFSTFAILHPDTLAGGFLLPLVPGGGSRETDCRGEFQVANPTNVPFLDPRDFGTRSRLADGDPACDADRKADGTCTFRLSICFDQTDANLPGCTAGASTGYLVKEPAPQAKDAGDAANGQRLISALTALGGTATGSKANDVHFTVPLAAPTCTGFASISVPLRNGKKVTKTVRGCAEEASRCRDNDRVKLRCLPAS